MAVINYNTNGITRVTEANQSNPNIKQDEVKLPRNISSKLDLLDTKLDSLYKSVYISRPDNAHNMNDIINKLDDSIDKLQSNEINVSGMSELLLRLNKETKKDSDSDRLMTSVLDLVSDTSLLNNLYNNDDVHKYILAQNYNYETLCKFIPKVLDALELKRDNVLCADNFSKRFLNPTSVKSNKVEIEKFANNCKKMERKYELEEFYDDTYMNVSIYGEDFLYIVPYKVAFERLLKRQNFRRNGARLSQMTFMSEAVETTSNKAQSLRVLTEGYGNSKDFNNYLSDMRDQFGADVSGLDKFEGFNVNLHFNDTNTLLDKLNERVVLENIQDLSRFESLSSVYESGYYQEAAKYNSVFDDVSKIKTSPNTYYNDGLVVPGSLSRDDKDPKKLDDNFVGAVLERIPRANIVPSYIGKKCLGYYYFEFKDDPSACGYCGGHHTAYGISNAQHYAYQMTEQQQELAMRYICSKMSQAIDVHFINANKDLSEEIYAVLKYNDQFDVTRANDIGVTFIPAEDIIHCYFKLDETTHRGISDLQRSLIPGMLYMLLYLSDIIGKITRSTDKRVYYVKQNIETNVARTMMNVVQQIKKGSR